MKRNNITHTTALLAVSKLKNLKVDWVDKRVDIITSYIGQQQKQEQALKRNEPMKVKIETYTNGFFIKHTCSVCGATIQKGFVYCPDCGQCLDWSE